MASQTAKNKSQGRSRSGVSIAEKLARLRAEVVRLKAALRAAKVRGKLISERRVGGSSEESQLLASDALPPFPPADADGYLPAVEFAYASLARTIIIRRKAVGWSQAELAARAGVRTETVNRLESGRHSPNVRTVDKIDAALQAAGV
jgi:DNA-binding XRE family transcriptional regulator